VDVTELLLDAKYANPPPAVGLIMIGLLQGLLDGLLLLLLHPPPPPAAAGLLGLVTTLPPPALLLPCLFNLGLLPPQESERLLTLASREEKESGCGRGLALPPRPTTLGKLLSINYKNLFTKILFTNNL
jgi:hypothetical protein